MDGRAAMVAANFGEELTAAFPELVPDLARLRSRWGEEPTLHLVVGDVLEPHVERVADAGEQEELRQACAFMERMAMSPDERLRNALQVSLLEVLGDDRRRLEKVRLAMGPATRTLSLEIERFWGRED